MPLHLSSTDYITHNDDVMAADCNSEVVLLRVKSARCHGMNAVGTHIWRRLSGPTQVAKLVDALQLEFNAGPAGCALDVFDFLEQLNRAGLIVPVQAPANPAPADAARS